MSLAPRRGPVQLAPRESALDVVRENLEAFAVAIVMALVIKHFCLEAFRIPTSSMRPTLLGKDDTPDGLEDRIVVDKWAYLVGGPARWDVAVFRYPLDKSRNFIKRVVGLPGEELRLSHGDVLVRAAPGDPWRIATKPRRLREALYRPLYPPSEEETGSGGRSPGSWWTAGDRADAWRVESHARFEFDGGEASQLTYAGTLHAHDSRNDDARDIRVRARLTPRGPGRVVLTWSPEGTWSTSLALVCDPSGADRSQVAFGGGSRGGDAHALDVSLAPGRPTEVEWEIVDGEVHVHVDGRERAVLPSEGPGDAERGAQALTLSASGAPVTLENLRIDRDLHYAFDGSHRDEFGTGLKIPEDGYVMLGDNTTSSSDSRVWQADGVRLKDGREVWWNVSGDSASPPRYVSGTDRKRVVDLEGAEREWSADDELKPDPPRRYVSFVPRENVVGRAFYVFWPAWPPFPRRLGWIH